MIRDLERGVDKARTRRSMRELNTLISLVKRETIFPMNRKSWNSRCGITFSHFTRSMRTRIHPMLSLLPSNFSLFVFYVQWQCLQHLTPYGSHDRPPHSLFHIKLWNVRAQLLVLSHGTEQSQWVLHQVLECERNEHTRQCLGGTVLHSTVGIIHDNFWNCGW